MGSLWAYEALTFGGYWAWDPVENTSWSFDCIDWWHPSSSHFPKKTGRQSKLLYFST